MIIGFMGDVMIGRLVNQNLEQVESTYLWGDALPEILQTDLTIANLEAALTHSTQRVEKVFNFKSHPKNVQTLLDAEIDVVNLANNHVLDYSEEGLLETLNTLDKAGIQHVGAGRTLNEASASLIISIQDLNIGILGFTDNEPTWEATPDSPGTRYVDVGDLEKVKEDITTLRQQVDILIVSYHWGPNMIQRPERSFVRFAHELVELGVDIFHGHSAHIFQGIEYFDRKLIMYDTGDFVDDYYVDPFLRNDRSFFFKVQVDKNGVQGVELIPVLISNFQVNLSEDEETVSRMQGLSSEFNTHLELFEGTLRLNR
ncbi:MAG: putative polyglutamine synthesis accessory protein [Chlamydiae bacterium]|nr:putative polyglutamine synthesis accessory protein [Chlamydiota bacterium]